MPEENPYRYEGSAESLAKSREAVREAHQPSSKALFLWSLFAAFLVALYLPLFVNPFLWWVTFFFLLLVNYPIGEFVFDFARKKNRRKAFFSFWVAAAKVTVGCSVLMFIFFLWLGYELEISFHLFLIGFGPQLCAASVPLFFLTRSRRYS